MHDGNEGEGSSGRRELEGALRFMHDATAAFTRTSERAQEDVQALVELLIAQGTITLRGYERRRELVALSKDASLEPYRAQLDATVDKYAIEPVVVDCAERLHLCRARCCTLSFHLSKQDLDEGVVRWSYDQPYRIKSDEGGRCVHNVATTGACAVHHARPAVCRSYDCREDPRIWKDFAAKVPAE